MHMILLFQKKQNIEAYQIEHLLNNSMFKVLSSDHCLGLEAGTETEVSESLKPAVLKNPFKSRNSTLISKFNQHLAEI